MRIEGGRTVLDLLGVRPGLDEKGHSGVPEIVKPEPPIEVRTYDCRFEVTALEVAMPDWATIAAGETKPTDVYWPRCSPNFPCLLIPSSSMCEKRQVVSKPQVRKIEAFPL